MTSPVVDCRSLIEFCKAYAENRHLPHNSPLPPSHHHYHHHKRSHSQSQSKPCRKKHSDSLNSYLRHPFCSHYPSVAMDIIILLLVLGALATLADPYFMFMFHGAFKILPSLGHLVRTAIQNASLPYVVGCVVTFAIVIAAWEIVELQSRKCGKPYCKGLQKAVEFDIQLESEECVKCMPPLPKALYGARPLELVGQDHKALETELKRMAPLNGRTVLIFRKTCGCPVGRMEVWGPKKLRRVKK